MQPPDVDRTLLNERIQECRADFDHLLQTLEAPVIKESSSGIMIGVLRRLINPLTYRLAEVDKLIDQGNSKESWESLASIQRDARRVMHRAQSFLGSVAISRSGLEGGMTNIALQLVKNFSQRAGIDWLPALGFSSSEFDESEEDLLVAKDAQDNLVRMTVPHWDIWHLPLVAHDYAFSVVKQNKVEAFEIFVNEQVRFVERLLGDEPPSTEEMQPFLPEVRAAHNARQRTDLPAFRSQMGLLIGTYSLRQKIHLWHLIADAFATYLMGPAYAYALIFLTLDPMNPVAEGERNSRNRVLPSDARRAAITLYTLQRMNEVAGDTYSDGPYTSDLKLLKAVWERALDISGFLKTSRELDVAMNGWEKQIYGLLEKNFGFLSAQTNIFWKAARADVIEILQKGNYEQSEHSVEALISGAWWCRPRYSDRIASLTKDCMGLLAGEKVIGLNAGQVQVQDEASRFIDSKLYDIKTDLDGLANIFNSKAIPQSDRDAVSGRLYRLLSECDFNLRGLERLIRRGAPASSSMIKLTELSGSVQLQTLRQETLDFLGGVLMRQENLDNDICSMGESLLGEYSRMTGVNWASRIVLGSNPLYSEASQVVHHRFPDLDVWSLPLMAHEFGHIIAPTTPELKTTISEQLAIATQLHPDAGNWQKDESTAYLAQRTNHMDEFFADAFATYCQGPSFAFNVLHLHLNPMEAYLARGSHPTHAERMELIIRVLSEMNQQEKLDAYENGPYDAVLNRLRTGWAESLRTTGLEATPVRQFHKVKAGAVGLTFFTLLNKYYRLGAQYQASEWKRAEEIAGHLLNGHAGVSNESLRNLLNIAWICRIRQPRQKMLIAKVIRSAIEQTLA